MPYTLPPDLEIRLDVPGDAKIEFANYTFVQTLGDTVVLSFFQAVQPIVQSESEAMQITHIPATCTQRLALPRAAGDWLLRGLAEVLGYDITPRSNDPRS